MDKREAMNRRQGSNNSSTNTRSMPANGNPRERKSFRSLICDESGIIIGEMVYRCLICSFISESMDKVRAHYQTEHVDIEDISNGEFRYINNEHCSSPAESSLVNEESTTRANNQLTVEPDGDGDGEPEEQKSSGINGSGSFGNKNRSGYITCPICSSTRFYSNVQRHYGQYTCSPCFKHFRDFLLNPRVFSCPNLGSCSMEVKVKCRACWLTTCIKIYGNVGDKQSIIQTFKPVKRQLRDGKDVDKEEGKDDEEGELEEEEIEDELEGDNEEILMIDEKETGRNIVHGNDGNDDNGDEKEIENSNNNKILTKKTVSSDNGDKCRLEDSTNEPNVSAPRSLNQSASNNNNNGTAVKGRNKNLTGNLDNKEQKTVKKGGNKRKRNWSCMKCVNCLKQECGKCIYCLDRPKYGGKFRLRQRCANRRCLLKLKEA